MKALKQLLHKIMCALELTRTCKCIHTHMHTQTHTRQMFGKVDRETTQKLQIIRPGLKEKFFALHAMS